MQIIPLSTQLPAFSPISSTAPRPSAPLLGDEERDRVELSGERPPLLGQAESLPGQGEAERPGLLGAPSDPSESVLPASDHHAGDGPADGEGVHAPLAEDPSLNASGEPEEDGRPGDEESDSEAAEASEERNLTGQELTDDQRKEVDRLKERDREVRAHEQAHVAAGGQYVRGGVQFEYETGPDGRRYAVGGEVSIDSSSVSGDPRKTIQKAQQIRRAAMAPAEPSGQDQRVAAAASQMEAEARQDLIEERVSGGDESEAGSEAVAGKAVEEEVVDVEPEASATGLEPAVISEPASNDDEAGEAKGVADSKIVSEASAIASLDPPSFDLVPMGDEDENGLFGEVVSPLDIPKIDSAGPAGGVVKLSYAGEVASPAGSFVDFYR